MTRKTKNTLSNNDYIVKDVQSAKDIASAWLCELELTNVIQFGLPEIDDRYNIWRIPLLNSANKQRVGEIVIDAKNSLIIKSKSTDLSTLEQRLLGRNETIKSNPTNNFNTKLNISSLRNTIAHGDSEDVLNDLPEESVDLIFTSPPYYNARPEYTDYVTYAEYLLKMRKIIQASHRVLSEGRFFVMNISPVLIRRTTRNEASQRIAVPFDMHTLFVEEGYDFIDDIIWKKPEGAGWATGRGRRFAADRNPLQYKPVPVTEYILVYRKKTNKLIDWNIRSHPNQDIVQASKIEDGYEKTNIWNIHPAYDKRHPAIFPLELAEKVIKYYSFINDVVLDPFAGTGTVGKAAAKNNRRFVLIEKNIDYIDIIREESKQWLGQDARSVLTLNCPPIDLSNVLL